MFFMLQILQSVEKKYISYITTCVLVTFLTPIEVTRHCHFIENSFTSDVSQSSEASIPKLDLFSLQLTRSKVASSNHGCPMSPETCLGGLDIPVAKVLNVLHGLPQNTGCKHGLGKMARTWFGHFVWMRGTFVNAGTRTQTHILRRMMYDMIQCLQLPLSSQPLSSTLTQSQLCYS